MVLTSLNLFSLLFTATFTSLSYVIVYRLWLSPVAKFPGPWVAKISFAYEGWYDIALKGKYTWKIRELHEKYGMQILSGVSSEQN